MPLNRCSLLTVLTVLTLPTALRAQDLRAGVDQRVELMTIVFRLAGNSEYNQCRVPRYAEAIDAWFGPHRDHPAIRMARALRLSRGVSYDAVMSFAVSISDAVDPRERTPFDHPASSLESRWNGAVHGRPFLDSLRQFVVDTRAAEFFRSQQELYDTTNARLARVLRQDVDLAWFGHFFGERPQGTFHLVPGVCNGGGSYGPRFQLDSTSAELYAIIGMGQVDRDGWPRVTAGLGATVVHEFNHSFVNPVFSARSAQFAAAGPAIFQPVAAPMRAQAYGNWQTVLYESVVRAAAARYAMDHQGDSAARAEIGREHGRSFLWIGELYDQLSYYEARRDSFPTLASFVPRLAGWWQGLAPRVPEMVRRYDARRPVFVGIEGDTAAIDPATTTLRLRFDRPMAGGYSINRSQRPGVATPRITGQGWDSTRTVFELQVQLEPGRSYELTLNGPYGGGFQSSEGIAARETRVSFRTR